MQLNTSNSVGCLGSTLAQLKQHLAARIGACRACFISLSSWSIHNAENDLPND